MIDVLLRGGRERAVLRRHPWVMSGSIDRVKGHGQPGDWARVVAADGRTLGFGFYSPESQIRVRMLSFRTEAPGDGLLGSRIADAVAKRASDPLVQGTNGVRLINGEGDDLPGLFVDRFDEVLVAKMTTAGMLARKELIASALQASTGAKTCLSRPDTTALEREGVAPFEGTLFGEEPADKVWIDERGRKYAVDVARGQKTGFYLDQRDSRDLFQQLARGRSVLDLYSHTGGFAIAAIQGGAKSVVLVESSADALELAKENVARNDPRAEARYVKANVHDFLRAETGLFELIAVDPPPLAKTKKDVDRAARAYKDSFLYAMKRAASGAFFLVWSCSHHVGRELLGQITFAAALDAKRSFQVLRELDQPSDHAVSVDHPEGRYLHGLLLRASSE